ncbi:MAG TPA: kelch repeat-containing protein [Candidatus Binatia bacterium]|nr:kelch repeat-containing protein [Candidatus Binatia bacterium]
MTGPPLPVARSEVAVATDGRSIYVIGGYANGNVDQSLVEVFHPTANDGGQVRGTWQDVAPLPRGLNHVGAIGYNGRIYAFGGFSAQNNSAVADASVYDPAKNTWAPIAPLPHALGSVSVAVLGTEIHLVGGRDAHSVGTHYVYDPVSNSYSTRAPLPVGRDHMGLVALDGRLYAVGGRIDTPAHNTSYVDVYDPESGAWTSGAPLPAARSGMAVATYRGKIFAMGGEQAGMSAAFNSNFSYDPSAGAWSIDQLILPEGRHGTGAVVVADKLFVPAGAPVPGGGRQSNTLFVFSCSAPSPC